MVVSTLSDVTSCVEGRKIIGRWVVKVAFMRETAPKLSIVRKRGEAVLSTKVPLYLVQNMACSNTAEVKHNSVLSRIRVYIHVPQTAKKMALKIFYLLFI